MRLQVRLRDSLLQDGHIDVIKRYARFALGRFEHRISRTELAIEDVNGPRQGPDKRCKVQVSLNGLTPIVVEVIDTDAIAAVNRALDRAARHVRDRLNRERDLRRQGVGKHRAHAG